MATNVLSPYATTTYWNNVTMSGSNTVDSILSPYKWGNNSTGSAVTNITYSFPEINALFSNDAATGYGTGPNERNDAGYTPLTDSERAIVRGLLAQISAVANIQFVETTDTSAGVGLIRIAKTTYQMDNFAGYAYEPGSDQYAGDVWINAQLPSSPSDIAGVTFQKELFLHEILHAVGLKHPFEASGTSTATLPQSLDSDHMTVMSYSIAPGLSSSDYGIDLYPTALMPFDIAALQYMYGANTTTNSGSNTYTFTYSDVKWSVIYDTGGTDTIVCNSDAAVNVNLTPGVWNQVNAPINYENGSGGLSAYTSTMYIQPGTVIENLVGGIGSDVLSGNTANNRIDGASGNDTIDGGAGNDVLIGGGGNDTFILPSGQDAIYGGTGSDIMQLSLNASQASIIKLRGNAFVLRADSGNIELARDVEQVKYANQTVNLSSQSIFDGVDQTLTQIYVAGFKRAPEASGYHYWANEMATRGITGVADVIFSLDVVKAIYPADMTSSQFVTAIYQNVFNRAPDTEGLNYWVTQLNAKSRGSLVIDMTNAAMNVPDGTDGKDYFQDRVDWSLYAVGYQDTRHIELTPAHLTTLTNGVNSDPLTALTLIGQAESGIAI